ncbi:type II secretion system F family protein [Rothia sp. P7181]|uniref:type II secretion system F family protein n=1 Tax=Rothia sp. P7181 TaxID=3402663 RepID=UPI003AE206D4
MFLKNPLRNKSPTTKPCSKATPPTDSSLITSTSQENRTIPDALVIDLCTVMLEAGLGLHQVLEYIAQLYDEVLRQEDSAHEIQQVIQQLYRGYAWSYSWQNVPNRAPFTVLEQSLGFLAATGAPSAQILQVVSDRLRRQEYRHAEQQAQKLGVRLVLPLGLCSLPSFICLGVIPLLISLIPSLGF